VIRFLNAYFPVRTVVLGATEACLTLLAFVAATAAIARQDTAIVLLYESGLWKIAVASLIFMLSMYYLDLYDTLVLSNRAEVLSRMLQVCGLVSVVLAFLYFYFPEFSMARSVFFLGLVLQVLFLISWREIYFVVLRHFKIGMRSIILGQSQLAAHLAEEVGHRPELGMLLVGYIDSGNEPASMNGLRCLGKVDELRQVVQEQQVQRVIVAVGERRGRLPLDELLTVKKNGTEVMEGLELYESVTGRIALESLRPSWLLFGRGFMVSPWMLLYKRTFSYLLGLPAIVISLPLMALSALAIKLDSPGPVIFRQTRIGKDGQPFTFYKFRTLFHNADRVGQHQPVVDGDARVTRVGRWLRRSRLDELPQLYNILRGDMHFVGPRPFVPNQELELAEQIPFYRQRWTVRPGATGWAQINRGYCATLADNEEKLSYDLYYIKNMSMGLDILILFQTIKILLLGRGGR
jgi:sugar transferase (PEP-CTERM system associated)